MTNYALQRATTSTAKLPTVVVESITRPELVPTAAAALFVVCFGVPG